MHLRRAAVVRRLSAGVLPSKMNTGRTRWKSSLRSTKERFFQRGFKCCGAGQRLSGSRTRLQIRRKKPNRWALWMTSPRWSRIAAKNWCSHIDASAGELIMLLPSVVQALGYVLYV